MKKPLLLLTFLLTLLVGSMRGQTVVDIIVNSPDHNTLEAAVIAAGLTDDLSGTGPFTVFAPTDAAFAALPADILAGLVSDPTSPLAAILTYHVANGNATSGTLSDSLYVTTLNGDSILVTIDTVGVDSVYINNALVTVADIIADNGVVHVINAVLLPSNVSLVLGCKNENACNYSAAATIDDGSCGALVGSACDDNNPLTSSDVTLVGCGCEGTTTVVDIIVNSADHDTLEAAVIAAGLADDLSGTGPFTVFAPTDGAFAALPAGTIESLLADPTGQLAQILRYHVVGATALSTDLVTDTYITTLNGDSVYVNINANGVFIDNAQVIVADLLADNGVVHVIDAVLIPDTNEVNFIDGCTDTLACNYNAAATIDDGSCGVLVGSACEDNDVYTENDVISAGCSCAGTEIDSVTVVDIIVNSPAHNTLETAVIAAGLAGTLSGEGPFTVFAPTDAAFAAVDSSTLAAVLADSALLADILLYHVVGVQELSTDLVSDVYITTLNGDSVYVNINANGVFIDNAQVIVADLLADNGVVHVIDAVLIPDTNVVNFIEGCTDMMACNYNAAATINDGTCDALIGSACDDNDVYTENDVISAGCSCAGTEIDSVTVVDIIVNSPNHTTLETAVIAAGLAGTLSGEGSFTVFAPTDAAFAAVDSATLASILADSALLADILLYHVVGAQALSTDLVSDVYITTLNGDSVYVNINANGVFIDNAQVIVADLLADNGVVHVIDAVILPGTDAVTDGCTDMMACNYDSTATIDNGTCFNNGDACDDGNAETINDMYIDCACTGLDLPNTVVDIVVNSADHDTLEAAVIAAGLADDLSGTGPFTVFAPTDAAFASLPTGTIEALLADPSGLLTDILLYHVVGAQALSTDLTNGMTITTLEGNDVTVTIDANGVFINNAQVIVADLLADNGVVHVIDAVLLPPVAPVAGCTDMMACNYDTTATVDDGSCYFVGDTCDDNIDSTENDIVMMDCSCMGTPIVTTTVWDIIQNSPDHTTLELAILTAGLDGALSGPGPFTVFAPTDAAFGQIDPLVLAGLLDSLPALNEALLYHVTANEYLAADLTDMMEIPMLSGDTAMITINVDGTFIDSAQITVTDFIANNGVVHVIDAVILPTMVVENNTIEFNIYPNPVKDMFRVNSSEYFNNQSLSIADATGRVVSNVSLNGYSQIVNVSDLPAGMYTITLTNGDAYGVSRFIKN